LAFLSESVSWATFITVFSSHIRPINLLGKQTSIWRIESWPLVELVHKGFQPYCLNKTMTCY